MTTGRNATRSVAAPGPALPLLGADVVRADLLAGQAAAGGAQGDRPVAAAALAHRSAGLTGADPAEADVEATESGEAGGDSAVVAAQLLVAATRLAALRGAHPGAGVAGGGAGRRIVDAA